MPEREWEREVDQLRAEMNRAFDRHEAAIQKCITESFYLQAQKQSGERFESLNADITEMKLAKEQVDGERRRDRAQMRLTLIAAGVTIAVFIATELLHAVAHV